MAELPDNPIGAAWLMAHCDINPTARLPVISRWGGRRATEVVDGYRLETYPDSMRPANNIAAHLQFHLRHEVPELEFLARLFGQLGPVSVQDWIDAEPTGQYARRAAFLYEWLTGNASRVPDRTGGNYVDVLDDSKMVTASPDCIVKNPRWRVNDNLPGTRYFCPSLVKPPLLHARHRARRVASVRRRRPKQSCHRLRSKNVTSPDGTDWEAENCRKFMGLSVAQ
ncbi:hypothetical protein [Burkholderia diffusa]|uniref:hypothetical protein n=1 Tax=Burkholderia diffusa TaxID=488732 RepID=UPI000A45C2A5|nr:hypothetical protein [Burkholderia diffusa]